MFRLCGNFVTEDIRKGWSCVNTKCVNFP